MCPKPHEVARGIRIGASFVDLPGLSEYLARQLGVRQLVCEGRATLNYHMLRAGLVDECFITVAPSIIGEPRPRTTVEGEAALATEDVMSLALIFWRRVRMRCSCVTRFHQ